MPHPRQWIKSIDSFSEVSRSIRAPSTILTSIPVGTKLLQQRMQSREAGLDCKSAWGLASLLLDFHSQPVVIYGVGKKLGSL